MLTDKELVEQYKLYGSCTKILDAYKENNPHCETVTDRALQYRLKKINPDYKFELRPSNRHDEDTRPIAAGNIPAPDKIRKKLHGKRYVFTSAQNNTFVHKKFLESLKMFMQYNKAELIVSTFAYNKAGFQNSTKNEEGLWYDPEIVQYIDNSSYKVADGIVYCGELDILPTAVNPISGLENYTRGDSAIIPHAKVAMQSMPRMPDEDPRFIYTTGAITQRNYIQRKAGQKAEFHHVFAALYVEIDEDGVWFARQLIADSDGVFHDLCKEYSPTGIKDSKTLSIVWGDVHLEKIDPVVADACWISKDCILRTLQPTYQFIHDLADFRARNHHNIKDPHFLATMFFNNTSNVFKDLRKCGHFLHSVSRYGTQTVVVKSNHDSALLRWLKEADVRKDPENAEFWHTANALCYRAIRKGEIFDVFKWAVLGNNTYDNIEFLEENDSFLVADIEHGMHGHNGPNGSKGTANGFRKLGRKINIGHSHSAGIVDGIYTAGVSGNLDMSYNKGPSSWSHSCIVTYSNGKRAILTIKDGRWRA